LVQATVARLAALWLLLAVRRLLAVRAAMHCCRREVAAVLVAL